MGRNYGELIDYLRERSDEAVVELSFAQLDRIVGGLPASARKYAAWWANTYSAQPHARFWLDAGRRANVDFNSGRVRFELGAPTAPRQRTAPAGESDNLSRRMSNYRNPGPTQPTNIRINERITSILAEGGSIELHVVLRAMVNDEELSLKNRAVRRLIENAALVELERRGAQVENL